ncbi:dynein regulation protein LC7 [Streptomyces tateyamensis]|uniref:Dynein regulation protein LC7 n=1 Tax=Streptomyces tateyamensis TaxID=565073 RepID=A0A2V4P2W4_9ACTN|nr:roadblock/LC7 domain-containing protein [Streptomyces tateyamensis]PYC78597.1 dynein regulation protein LC7 [Streptomyces tateyamensis]
MTDPTPSTPAAAGRPASQGAVSQAAMNVRWLLANLLGAVPGVSEAVVVSSDGLLLADSEQGRKADQLSAIISALTSLTCGLAQVVECGSVRQTMVTMGQGHLVVMAISDGSCLGVYASLDCDLGVLAYQMALLVERAGHALTPQVRSELHRAMAVR